MCVVAASATFISNLDFDDLSPILLCSHILSTLRLRCLFPQPRFSFLYPYGVLNSKHPTQEIHPLFGELTVQARDPSTFTSPDTPLAAAYTSWHWQGMRRLCLPISHSLGCIDYLSTLRRVELLDSMISYTPTEEDISCSI